MFSINPGNSDARQYAAATERNRDPILQVLQQVLPPTGTILELASGTGQHAAFFAPRLTPRYWLPSDPAPSLRASIRAWSQVTPTEHLLPTLAIDACEPVWPVEDQRLQAALGNRKMPAIQAIVNINMIHISPWEACLGLLSGAQRVLPPEGVLYLYGPYQREDQPTAESNVAFDEWLRAQNPAWGVRHLKAVVVAAADCGLQLQTVIDMPANNLSVVFRRK
jgi:SAM-dependent methyltransferase